MSFFGSSELQILPDSTGWDPRSGSFTQKRWRGTPTAVRIGAAQLQGAGIRWQIEASEDSESYQILVGYYGADETQPLDQPLADQWELVDNGLEKNVWELPKIAIALSAIPMNEVGMIALRNFKSIVTAFVAGDRTWTDENGDERDLTYEYLRGVTEALGLQWDGFFDRFIMSLLKGVEAFRVSQYVLRRTITIGSNSSIRPSLLGVNKIYTTAGLIASEAIPNTLKFELGDGYWLKQGPHVQQVTSDKWQITQEWWYAESFDDFVYEYA